MRMSTNRDGDFRVGGSDQRSLRVYAGAGGDSCVNMRASLQVTADVCDRTVIPDRWKFEPTVHGLKRLT